MKINKYYETYPAFLLTQPLQYGCPQNREKKRRGEGEHGWIYNLMLN